MIEQSLSAVPIAPFLIGGAALFIVGDEAKDVAVTVFEQAMFAIWDVALAVLKTAFKLADRLSVFSITEDGGPVDTTWPVTLWISGVVAVGLFFWQLTTTALRGGRGFVRLVGGPAQYGIALGVTVGLVAAMLIAADELTRGILDVGLDVENFTGAFKHTNFSADAVKGLKSVMLGICALIGVLPAAFGYVLEMLFREAAIHLLIAVVPITAAGLTAGVTSRWYWTTIRWILAAIAMKPVLALTLVLGVAVAGGTKGLSGLLVGIAVLLMSLFAPLILFRFFAFVDPHSDAGAAFRDTLASMGASTAATGNPLTGWALSRISGGGNDSSSGGGGGDTGGGSSSDLAEARTTQRFDASADAFPDSDGGDTAGGGVSSVGGGHAGARETGGSGRGGGEDPATAATVAGGGGAAGAAAAGATAAGGSDRPDPAVAGAESSGSSLSPPLVPDPGPTGAGGGWGDGGRPEALPSPYPGEQDQGAPPPSDDEDRHRPYGMGGEYDDGTVI